MDDRAHGAGPFLVGVQAGTSVRDAPGDAAMTTRCAVCLHPAVGAIDALVLAGSRSMSAIARDFGLHEKSMQRHARSHVAPRRARTSQDARDDHGRRSTRPADAEAATVDPAAALRSQLAALDDMDANDLSPSARISLFEERRRTLEALARVEPVPPSSVVDFRQVDGLAPLLADMMLALEPYPDARLALLDVVRRHDVG